MCYRSFFYECLVNLYFKKKFVLGCFRAQKYLFQNTQTYQVKSATKDDLNNLGVHHDVFTSEKKITTDKAVNNTVSFLKKKKLAYEGFQDPPKGIKEENWKKKNNFYLNQN